MILATVQLHYDEHYHAWALIQFAHTQITVSVHRKQLCRWKISQEAEGRGKNKQGESHNELELHH